MAGLLLPLPDGRCSVRRWIGGNKTVSVAPDAEGKTRARCSVLLLADSRGSDFEDIEFGLASAPEMPFVISGGIAVVLVKIEAGGSLLSTADVGGSVRRWICDGNEAVSADWDARIETGVRGSVRLMAGVPDSGSQGIGSAVANVCETGLAVSGGVVATLLKTEAGSLLSPLGVTPGSVRRWMPWGNSGVSAVVTGTSGSACT